MPGYQYQEGGGKFPPYQEDYFQRIVNVQWLSAMAGIFVMGDFCCFTCYLEVPSKDKFTPKPLGSMMYGDHGDIYAGSYRKVGGTPTFLEGGDCDGTVVPPQGGIITASSDGQNWTIVHRLNVSESDTVEASNVFGTIQGIVWDGDAFWACGHQTIPHYNYASHGEWIVTEDWDILLSSTDGRSWSEVDRRLTATNSPGGSTNDPTQQGLLVSHCNPRVTDRYGNAVPDGIYHYSQDPQTGQIVFIRPDIIPAIDYTFGGLNQDNMGTTITIQVTTSGATTTKNVDVGLGVVTCVAYTGGVIVAAGEYGNSSAFAISTDMGDTWGDPQTYSPDFEPVLTISAAPPGDIQIGQDQHKRRA